MPTYDYRCRACDYEFELFQQMSDPVKRKCPECGKLQLERLIGTGAGVIFKGGGFYETDYRSDSYKKAAEAEKSAATNGQKEPKADKETKAEKKADEKATAKPATKSGKKASVAKGRKSKRGH